MINRLREKSSDKLSPRNSVFLDFIKIKNLHNKKILDIGCGFGWFEYSVKNIVKKVIGIDINKYNIRKLKSEFRSKKVDFLVASALNIPFKDNFFDYVVSCEVIEHLPKNSEKYFFKEIVRVLKPGGKFFMTTPYKNIWSIFFDPAWWLIKHRHYSYNELKKMTKNIGLVEMDYQIVGGWWNLLGLLNMYISKWIFRREKFFKKFFDDKENKEMLRKDGFMNLFISFRKI